MNGKLLTRRLDALSTNVWREAIQMEKLRDKVEDLGVAAEAINIPASVDQETAYRSQDAAAKRLRELSFKLSGMEAELQEIGWAIDEIVDLIEDMIPSKSSGKL